MPRTPATKYHQLRDFLRGRIVSGEYEVGTTIPAERDLQATFGVSRSTVRHALRDLTDLGLVRATVGVGTVVIRSRPAVQQSSLRGFTEDLAVRGTPTTAHVVSAVISPPPPHVRDRLELPATEAVLHLVRLRSVAGTPLALMHNFVPASIGIGVDEDFTRPLYELLERDHERFITYGRDSITARAAREDEAQHLDVSPGTPVLNLKRIAYVEHDRPIEYVEAAVRGDLYEYNVTLLRGKERR